MTREIGFRAWDKDLKCYFYDVAVYPNNIVAIQRHNIESMMLNAQYGATHWTELGKNVVVEQYTGLKDKNGKKIYVGDIMRYDAIDYQVLWADYYASFETKRLNSPWSNEGLTLHFLASVGSVIGNIHENPELLK